MSGLIERGMNGLRVFVVLYEWVVIVVCEFDDVVYEDGWVFYVGVCDYV